MHRSILAAILPFLFAVPGFAQSPAPSADPNLPPPGTRGNADNVPYIGKSDAEGNPVRLAKATGHVSNYSEEKIPPYTLPDALVTIGGERVTSAEQWHAKRRPEILKFYQNEIYGRIPGGAPKVTWRVTETDAAARDGAAILKRLVGVMGDRPDGPQMNLTVYLPAKAEKPVPLLLNLTFGLGSGARRGAGATARQGAAPARGRGAGGGFDPVAEVLSRGWGYATLGYNEIQPDRADRWTEGVIGLTLAEGQTRPAPDQWGTISAWAWGVSRAIDYFETETAVNAKQIAITGASRLGKTVLWAGAQDDRVAAVFSVVPGEMGASLIRRDWGETLDDMAQNFAWQFAGNLQKWVGKWNELPVDQHMLIALCAPRPVYVNGGLTDQWSDPKGEFLALVGAGPVYRLLGAKDLGVTELPPFDKPITDGDLAFHYHSRGHTAVPADWTAFLTFAERHFQTAGRPKSSQTDDNVQSDLKADRRSLRAAAGSRFKVGVGISHVVVQNPEDASLIRQHFQVLTPENCMKPQSIHPAEDNWNFDDADRFVDFARANKLEVVGHCLVWAKDDRTDPWMMQENGKPVSRETLLRRIETHVSTVVDRYADAATAWDVVNEAVGDSGDGLLRDSIYSRTTGIDFIVTAFKAARAKDPDALLIYNDYNDHLPGKREKVIKLLTELKHKGAPVDAYGMQGHFELGDNSLPQLRETFAALRKLGLKVVISELDIDVVTRGRWWAEGGKYRDELARYNPYQDGLPTEVADKQAREYVELFKLFIENSDIIERVSFWNLHDGQSWLNYFPWRRVNHPLLFDRDRRPKPAFDAVYAALENQPPAHAAIERRDENSRIAHQQLLAKVKQGRIDVYFQGDSITRRWGATDYPKFLAHWKRSFHGWNAANFAWGGDTTHNILWRMQNGELDGVSPRVVVLQAGTNNLPGRGAANDRQVDDVVGGIRAIIAEFQKRVPDATIIVTAVFPRTQNGELAPAIRKINEHIAALADGKRIRFLNINDQLADSTGRLLPEVSSDGLHLAESGYEIWAQALKPIFEELLGPPAKEDHAPPATGDPRAGK
jgi:GH35 family endo-1,4-beta-xylanase/lysophospholipase L1-like esterase